MKSKKLAKRMGKITLLLSLVFCFVTIGIFMMARETHGGALQKFEFRKIYREIITDGGIELAEPGPGEELELVLIKAEVLSLAAVGKSNEAIGESFLYVKNQGEIGEDVIVCFMPGMLADVFAVAMANDYTVQAWGVEIPRPGLYSGVTTKAFVVFAARALHPDVPNSFNNLGIFHEFMPGQRAELK